MNSITGLIHRIQHVFRRAKAAVGISDWGKQAFLPIFRPMKNHKVRHHIIFWVAYFLFQAYLEFEWMKTTETYGKWSTVKQALYSLGAESMLLPIKLSTTYLFLYILRKVGSEMNKAWLAWILTVVLMAGATLLTRQVVIHVIIKEFYNDPEMVAAQQKSYTIFRFLWGMIDVMLYMRNHFCDRTIFAQPAIAAAGKNYCRKKNWKRN